jgi:spore germination cell wall hydrolase CwlJ-like protein
VLISVFTFSPIEKAIALSKPQLNCLAEAVYFEARGEPKIGQKLVTRTILQRVESSKFPNTICGVINQKKQFKNEDKFENKIKPKIKYKRENFKNF